MHPVYPAAHAQHARPVGRNYAGFVRVRKHYGAKHLPLRRNVKRGCGLVKQHYGCISQHRAGYGYALRLPFGKPVPVFANGFEERCRFEAIS